jgi:cytochrome P450
LISIIGINCHRNYWKDALSFQFPRQEFEDNSFKTIAYKPFLSGPRVCGGMKLARRELKSALMTILELFDIGHIEVPMKMEYSLTSRPSTNLDEYLKRRSI